MAQMERHNYDIVVIGAGGAGLRAAVEARDAGLRVAIICKSLFGKAHTVMAEGGVAASMGNVNENDGWKVHFRDTMRGGKFLNHYRMAELHAKESPDRVWELEVWGALLIAPQKERFPNVTSVDMSTHVLLTLVTEQVLN
jgi:succinate dehydrogenase / fumarate reductase flavoprotein subunit